MTQNVHFLGGIKERLDYIYNNYTRKDNEIARALDIGAGKGSASFYLANTGFHVDAVDIRNREEFQWENRFDHQFITRYHQRIEDFQIIKKYNIILITNVIMFLKRDYVISELLTTLQNHLHTHGVLCIAFLQTHNIETKQKLKHQHWFQEEEIIQALDGCTLIQTEITHTVSKTHPKHGDVEFFSKIFLFQKS